MVGTYLGKKKVLTIGAGFVSQKNAMWQLAENKIDTVEKNMLQLSGDVFYDVPTSNNGQALSVYCNYTYFDFGNYYIRNLGVMNPANGLGNKDFLNGLRLQCLNVSKIIIEFPVINLPIFLT
jgi:hypothetical protein